MGRTLLAAVLVLTTGCATVTVGREFDPAALQALTPGESTTADVLAAAGEPYVRTILVDGSEQWVYLMSTAHAVALPFYVQTQSQGTTTMVLQFRDGVLVKPQGTTGTAVGQDFDPAVFRTFTPGATTTDEVRAAAGEPWVRNVLSDGTEQWMYLSTKAGGQTQTMTLRFVNGVLVRP